MSMEELIEAAVNRGLERGERRMVAEIMKRIAAVLGDRRLLIAESALAATDMDEVAEGVAAARARR